MTNLEQWINQVGINNIIWITDLDDTVIELSKNVTGVNAPSGLEDSFHAIDTATQGRFFVVTGREMSYVDKLFPKKPLKASTEYHNVMRWDENSAPVELNQKPQWHLIDPKFDAITKQYWPNNFTARRKPFMRSIHYPQAPLLQDPKTKDHVRQLLQDVLDDYEAQTGQKLVNIDGGAVFDIAPDGSSKGPAIQDIVDAMAAKFPGRKLYPVYFGDSPGDLDAVPVIQANGGKFISVGPNPRVTSVADFQLNDTAECRALFAKAGNFAPKVFVPPAPKPAGLG